MALLLATGAENIFLSIGISALITLVVAFAAWPLIFLIVTFLEDYFDLSRKTTLFGVAGTAFVCWLVIGSLFVFIPREKAKPVPRPGPVVSFCDTHACINNFWDGNGSVVQCADGMWSHSGGMSGACAYHGGVG